MSVYKDSTCEGCGAPVEYRNCIKCGRDPAIQRQPTPEEIAAHNERGRIEHEAIVAETEAAYEKATIEDASDFVRRQEDIDGGTDDWDTGGMGDLALRGISKSRDALEAVVAAVEALSPMDGIEWDAMQAAYVKAAKALGKEPKADIGSA